VSAVPNRRTGKQHGAWLVASSLAASLLVGVGAASGSGGGGITAPDPPVAKDVRCIERCLDVRVATETGKAEITGRNLQSVAEVRLRSDGQRVAVEPDRVRSRRVEFSIPEGAGSGRPVAVDDYGNKSRVSVRLEVKPAGAIDESGEFALKRAEVSPSKTFFNARRRSKLEYLFEADGPTDIRVDVLKGKKHKVVDSIVKRDQEPFTNLKTRWNGLTERGKVAPNGKYKLKVSRLSGGDSAGDGFRYYDHKFPLRGRHSYGDGLGAGRGHQGQDVFARCGTKVVAARGGRVQTRAYHSAAGYYIVVDGRKTGVDYVYMHLSRKGRAKMGAKVRTGERIGFNDDTGNASGCHLHFEMWSAPGWYEGGHVLNPTKRLKRWDRWS
jgi:murein DD-endopeptidase MepM/ murein hydrolase activator NlpD